MAIEKITKFSDTIQPADIINEVVDVVNNADLEEFVGASESEAGKKGIVPAPEAGSEDRYLNADGTWKEVKQNLTIYTSLEQIGITPGEETFEAIYNALKINEEVTYWYWYNSEQGFNNEFYPHTHGLFSAIKPAETMTCFCFIKYINGNNKNIGIPYYAFYDTTNKDDNTCFWNHILNSDELGKQQINSKLSISPTSNWEQLSFYSSSGYYRALECDDARLRLDLRDTNNVNSRRFFDFYTKSYKANISDALYLYQQDSNDSSSEIGYRIYGAHNLATQAEAEAGTDNNKPMSPLRVKQAITYRKSLPENTDLNTIDQEGAYYCFANARAATFTNCPIDKAFILDVVTRTGAVDNGMVWQYLTQYQEGSTACAMYVRAFYSYNGAPGWGSWGQIAVANGGTITGNLTVNGTITGTTVVGAVYNDYAEFFPRGEETEAGDIIMLDPNSEEEKYIKASTSIITEYPLVVGVHSEEYSHLIGGELPENGEDFYDYNIDKYIPVGLAGRCKVKIKGKAIKGAPVTISDTPGVGICTNNNININSIVGYLVESDNIEDENTIRLLKVKLK